MGIWTTVNQNDVAKVTMQLRGKLCHECGECFRCGLVQETIPDLRTANDATRVQSDNVSRPIRCADMVRNGAGTANRWG